MLLSWLLTHKTAPLQARERFAMQAAERARAQQQLLQREEVRSCLVISTCNRTEIHLGVPDTLAEKIDKPKLDGWMAEVFQAPAESFAALSQFLQDDPAISHLVQVAAGMDSQLLGDAQILGQLRQAWKESMYLAIPDEEMQQIMRAVFRAAKRIRAETALGAGAVSVASVAARQYCRIFRRADRLQVLLLGAGKTARLTAQHLRQQGVRRFLVAGRDPDKVRQIAREIDGEGLSLPEATERLWQADIVVGASASPQPLLNAEQVRQALQKRRYKPQLLLDLAVPRDIDEGVGELEEAYLVNLDHLREEADDNLTRRQRALPEAVRILAAEMARYSRRAGFSHAAELVREFRHLGERDAARSIEKMVEQLKRGNLSEEELHRNMRALSRRLMHLPTLLLREAGRQGASITRQRWQQLKEAAPETLDPASADPTESQQQAATDRAQQTNPLAPAGGDGDLAEPQQRAATAADRHDNKQPTEPLAPAGGDDKPTKLQQQKATSTGKAQQTEPLAPGVDGKALGSGS